MHTHISVCLKKQNNVVFPSYLSLTLGDDCSSVSAIGRTHTNMHK